MIRTIGLLLLVALLGSSAVSCASHRGRAKPDNRWIVDGVELGTIKVTKDEDGSLHEFFDSEERLVRAERHLPDGSLDPAFVIPNYVYDEMGQESQISFTSSTGEPTMGPEGFAMLTVERRDEVTNFRYFDTSHAPLALSSGFHREEALTEQGRLIRRRFYCVQDQPVGAQLEYGPDVFEIRYDYLRGVTPILYATYFSTDGHQYGKEMLAGSTSEKDWVAGRSDAIFNNTNVRVRVKVN